MPVDWVVIGLDNGGTTNNGTVLASGGRFLLDQMAEVPSNVREGPDKAIESLVESVDQVLELTGVPATSVKAVGLDTPGPASADGVISSKGATNFGGAGWGGFDIRGALAERLGLPVVYNNDGNAAALYAHHVRFGGESWRHSSVSAIVGTGLGGGLIEAGRVIKGAAGMAGELGHVTIPLDGLLDPGQPVPACNCGLHGDAESVASLTGIQNNLLPYWLTRYPGHELGGLPLEKAARLVRRYGEQGDEMALTIFRQQAMALGRLFTIAANFFDPGEYFLGGGVVEAAPHFRDWFLAEVRASTVLREEQARAAEISLVPDLDMAGARGSAIAARDWLISWEQGASTGRPLSLRRGDDDHHGEADRLGPFVGVTVRAAGREAATLAGPDLVALGGDRQGQGALLDPGHLTGGRRVRVAAERLAGHDFPVPQLDRPRRVRRADDRPGASGRPAPEHARGIGAADPDGRLAAHVDEQRHGDAERVADPRQRGQVRVGPALLERDEHALAHPGARGELIQ
jgi:glucokinase